MMMNYATYMKSLKSERENAQPSRVRVSQKGQVQTLQLQKKLFAMPKRLRNANA